MRVPLPVAAMLFFALFDSTAASWAESKRKTREDIARLQSEIPQARAAVDPLAAPWMRSKDLTLDISGELMTDAIQEINKLNVTRAELSATGHSGQLWGWEADCRVWNPLCNWGKGCWHYYGKEGAYIEFNDNNYRFQARAALENIRGTWVPFQGLRVDLHASLHAEVGMLKGNRYLCGTGGFGANGGPANGDASGDVYAFAKLGGLTERGIPYSLDLGVENIRYGLQVDMGELPDLVLDGTFPGVSTNLSGVLGVPLTLEGDLQLPTAGGEISRHYRLALQAPGVSTTGRAIRAEADILVDWQ